MINGPIKMDGILPGVSFAFSWMVFSPKLYLGAVLTVAFSGEYAPGANKQAPVLRKEEFSDDPKEYRVSHKTCPCLLLS